MVAALTPVEEALATILARATEPPAVERVPILQAQGRVLAEDQYSAVNVPPCDNSAMDGYALRYGDIAQSPASEFTLKVSQRIAAGATGELLAAGSAARIFTGAAIPPGADTVIMQEDVELSGDSIRGQLSDVRQGQHIRPEGQDIAAGSVIVKSGRRLRPQEVGVLASVGLTEVPVYRPLKVAIISTGDELVEPGAPLKPGQIYNSNRYTLSALLAAMGFQVLDGGIVADSLEVTTEQLRRLAEQADVVISSGGVSVGEEDHVKAAVEALGELALWKLNIKPGKPLAFGHIDSGRGDIPFIGLPGNPSSVFVTFNVVARPYLLKSQGVQGFMPTLVQVRSSFDWQRAGSRQEYIRARVTSDSGVPQVESYPNQSSGVLLSTCWANALVVLPPKVTVKCGDWVDVILLSELAT